MAAERWVQGVYKTQGEYPCLQARDESDTPSTIHRRWQGRIFHALSHTFTRKASISDYTGVQDAGSPPHSPSENPQPQSSG